jgi:transposase
MNDSVDLRQRVINWVLDGHTRKNASEVFKVHYQTVNTWVSRYLKTGECASQKALHSKSYKLDLEALRQDVQKAPDSFQSERACRFGVVQSTVSKAMSKWGLTRKKKPLVIRNKTKNKNRLSKWHFKVCQKGPSSSI